MLTATADRVGVLPRDVKFLLTTYGLSNQDDPWNALLTLARESRQRGWWQQYGEAVPDWFEIYVGLEAEAATIFAYDAEFAPGILQTEDYAWAVHQAQMIGATNAEIDRLVKVRMARQEILGSSDAPQLWLILNEAVIRRVVGNGSVMREQLDRMIEVSLTPSLTIQVIPFNAGAHAAMDGAFSMLGFPEPSDPQIVYVEYHTGALYLEKHQEVERYRLMFDHLRASALPVEASRALMARIAEELP